MTPLTVKPTVVLLVDEDGKVDSVATNVAPDLNVVVLRTEAEFNWEAASQPFSSNRSVAGVDLTIS